MKLISLTIAIVSLSPGYSCSNSSSKKEPHPGVVSITPSDSTKINRVTVDTIKTDKYVAIYKFDSTFSDSSLVCEQWFLEDTLVKGRGVFYYSFPFQSEFVDNWVIKSAKGKAIYETFDSLICEVGGQSAWNKYIFNYDDKKRPQLVKHYKAWWDVGPDDDSPHPSKPAYFLGETIYFYYNDNESIQVAKKKSGKRIEKITKRFDDKSRLKFEEWDAWDTHRFRIYYLYKA